MPEPSTRKSTPADWAWASAYRRDPVGGCEADEPDADRRALGDQGDRDIDLAQVGVDGVFCAWQDDQSRGVHASTLGRRPKKEPGSEGL